VSLLLPLCGGLLIGLAAALLLVLDGRIAGISGIVGELFAPRSGEVAWRLAFLAGMLTVGAGAALLHPAVYGAASHPAAHLVLAGGLVGIGTRLANGCTSGHGVCGIPRGSVRSIVATGLFMAAAMVTVALAGGAA